MARKRSAKTAGGVIVADGAAGGEAAGALVGAAVGGPDGATLMLDATLEIGQVSAARERLLAFLDGGAASAVDVSRISSIDTAGVQLLLAVRREAQLRGTTLRFRGESAALTRALARLGLGVCLPIDAADAG